MIREWINSYVRKIFRIGLSDFFKQFSEYQSKNLILLGKISTKLTRILMIEAELAAELKELTGQMEKVFAEVKFTTDEMRQTISALETQLAAAMAEINREISSETLEALNKLKANIQMIDDLTPDVVMIPNEDPAPEVPVEEPNPTE